MELTVNSDASMTVKINDVVTTIIYDQYRHSITDIDPFIRIRNKKYNLTKENIIYLYQSLSKIQDDRLNVTKVCQVLNDIINRNNDYTVNVICPYPMVNYLSNKNRFFVFYDKVYYGNYSSRKLFNHRTIRMCDRTIDDMIDLIFCIKILELRNRKLFSRINMYITILYGKIRTNLTTSQISSLQNLKNSVISNKFINEYNELFPKTIMSSNCDNLMDYIINYNLLLPINNDQLLDTKNNILKLINELLNK